MVPLLLVSMLASGTCQKERHTMWETVLTLAGTLGLFALLARHFLDVMAKNRETRRNRKEDRP